MLGHATMAPPAGQMIGRAAELGSLETALTELPRGGSTALEFTGEPGIGKTRLLAELEARADARGYLVLAGSASELESDLPFGVFVDALDAYVKGLEPRRLDAMDPEARAELPQILPSLPASDGAKAMLQIERYRTHRAVRGLLEALAAPKPLVLILDDLHWADPGSIELLGALLRRPPDASVLIALAVRPRQVPKRLAAALARAQALARIDLAALALDEARELIGAAEAEAVYEQSGGNPFYLQQLMRFPDARTVGAALAEELATLGGSERRVLEGAAVAGDPFEPDMAAAAADVPEATALDVLDALLDRDLVRPTEVPRRFRFRHPLVRHAIYEAAPGGWRLGAHERCAAALAERGAAAAMRAHHVEHAAAYGDMEAVALLREAGEEIAQRTPAGAARWFDAALRLLPAAAPPPERISLLAPLARAHVATGRLDEARAAVLECIRMVPGEVRLVVACAGIERAMGRQDAARARLLEALDALPDPAAPEAAALMIDLGIDASLGMDYRRSQVWGERALAVARPLGDRSLIAAATGVCALGLACAGAAAEAEPYYDEAVALVDAMPDDELAVRLDALASVAAAEGYLDRFEQGLAHARRGFEIGRATGRGDLLPVLYPAAATAVSGLGRLPVAAEILDGAIEGARLADNPHALAWNLLTLGLVHVLAGDVEASLTAVEESVDVSRGVDSGGIASFARVIHGHALIEHGDHERGVETLIAATGAENLPTVPGPWRAWALDHLTKGCLALGRNDAAVEAAREAEAVAASTGLRFAAAAARRARARIVLEQGDAVAAAEHALASVAAAGEVGAQLEAAVSRVIAGRALVETGDAARAAEELEQAAAAFEECGALRRRDEAERELGKLGKRRHRRTRRGPGEFGMESLTERELEVARLVVDRRTNAQIAAELFLSTKTVESHMRNLFRKLDVSSRVEVARVVERAERSG